MANTQVGIYNYRHCIEIHIPSLGAQKIVDALNERIDNPMFRHRLSGKFSDTLFCNGVAALLKWNDSSRSFNSFTTTEQKHIWNAYCIATWDIAALKSANIEQGIIKYHLADGFILEDNDFYRQQELLGETDYWGDGTT